MSEGRMDAATGEILRAAMPAEVAAAIVKVKAGVKQLGSDERNQHGGYNYVSVDKFYERIGPLMAAAGLALLVDEVEAEVRANEKTGSPWLFAQYELTFMHASGALAPPLRRRIALPISGPQAFGAAQSYIEKQFLRQVFKVPTGEKDADETPTNGEPPARSRPAPQADRQGSAPPPHAPAVAPGGAAAPAGTKTEHPRYTEALDFFKATRSQVAAAPHLEALRNVMRDAGFVEAWEREDAMPAADSRAALLLEVAPDKGYAALLETARKRAKMLAKAEPAGFEEPAA